MSTLKDKLKKLSFFTHYPKEHESIEYNNVIEEYPSKEEKWDEWFNSEYINGKWYLNEYTNVVYQSELLPQQVSLKVRRQYVINGNTYYYINSTQISNWLPSSKPSGQKTYNGVYFTNNGGYYVLADKINIYGASGSNDIPSSMLSGTATITINPYYDASTDTYYTGVKYKVTYENLTTSDQSFDIEILDMDENVTSPVLLYESPTNSPSSYTKINSATLSWDTNGYYVATNNGSNTFESVILPISNCPTNLAAEVDINYQNNGSNIQPRFGFLTNSSNGSYYGVRLLHSDNVLDVIQFKDGANSGVYGHAATLNYNTWYKLKIIYKNGYFYSLLYDSNGQLNSSVGWEENITPIGVAIGLVANNNKVWFKNLKIYEVD